MKYRISNAAGFLYDAGVSFHASGVLSDSSGAKLFDFYKTDFVTDAQKTAILNWCPKAQFRGAYAEYAPELRGVYICFPKAAALRSGVSA